jgi:hypothetical protein
MVSIHQELVSLAATYQLQISYTHIPHETANNHVEHYASWPGRYQTTLSYE